MSKTPILSASDTYATEVVERLTANEMIERLPDGLTVRIGKMDLLDALSFAFRAGAEQQRKIMIERIGNEFPAVDLKKPH